MSEKAEKLLEESHLFKKTDPMQSLILLRRAIFLDPENVMFYVVRGEVYFLIGDFKSSILNLRKALSMKPENKVKVEKLLARSLNLEGLKLMERKSYFVAKAMFEESLKYNSENDFAKLHIGTSLLFMDESNQQLGVKILFGLDHVTPHVNLILAHYFLNVKRSLLACKNELDVASVNYSHLSEFKKVYRDFVIQTDKLRSRMIKLLQKKRYNEAIVLLDELILYFPNDYDLYFKRAQCRKDKEDYRMSIPDFLKCRSITGGRDEASERQLADCLFESAKGLFEDDDYIGSIEMIDRSMKCKFFLHVVNSKGIILLGFEEIFFSDIGKVFILRGDCRLKLNNYESAKVDYDIAFRLDPKNPVIINRLVVYYVSFGQHCMDDGKYKEAENLFTRALSIDRLYAQAWLSRARTRFFMSKALDGIEDLVLFFFHY